MRLLNIKNKILDSHIKSWENPRCEILKVLARLKPMGKTLCLQCKGGRLLCGRQSCPLLQKVYIQNPIEQKLSQHLAGPSPPSLFVGWHNYPQVFVGPMGSIGDENAEMLDNPAEWYGLDFNDIIKMRSMLVRSKAKHNVKQTSSLIEDMQELTLSVRAIDVEIKFRQKPRYSLSFSPISQPMGPTAELEKFSLAENPKIPDKVDKVVNDELKAAASSSILFERGFDVYYLTKLLSAGLLGLKKKLVPTRWSITATDTIIANELLKKIRTYPQLNEYFIYSNTYLDNHFEVLLMPGAWSFEQFEAWAPRTFWTLAQEKPVIAQESEGFAGRSDYALSEGGGYYAGRFAVCEFLERVRRQATAVVFREIYDSYVMPVGVWEVRENVRHAFMKKPLRFSSLNDALKHISSTLTVPLKEFLERSAFLRQKKLSDFAKA